MRGSATESTDSVYSPPPVVEPVEEVEEPLRRQELGGAEVEVRVELVDHRLVADLDDTQHNIHTYIGRS